MTQVIERKIHIDGRVDTFECTARYIDSTKAVLYYIWKRTRPYQDGAAYLPAGDVHTVAYYWSDRNYLIYHLASPDGQLYGYRIDVCEDVRITPSSVTWNDLVLDFWIDPQFSIHVLDERELEERIASGEISSSQKELIERVRTNLMTNYKEIIDNLT